MPSVDESVPFASPKNAAERVALRTISENQQITFTKYVRTVLPFDGFVFWVRADLLSSSALLNAGNTNGFFLNEPSTVVTPAATIVAQGSMHYASSVEQDEDEVFTVNRVVFNTPTEIQDFNQIGPNVIFIGVIDGIQFAFSRRGNFYASVEEYHYEGDAVYSAMSSQIVDDILAFDARNIVISNSLPIWLTLSQFFPIFPSFAAPENLRPPYATVHIGEEDTTALQPVPHIDCNSSHFQLASDEIKFVIYGARNFTAADFIDYVLKYISMNDDVVGLMTYPVIKDAKRTQVEISTLAQKKVIGFKVSYYQTRINAIARGLIKSCIPNFYIEDYVLPYPWPPYVKPSVMAPRMDFSKKANSMYLGI